MTEQQKSRIAQILELERIDKDIFRGNVIPSRFQRTFGGQVAAQCLVAATETVRPDHGVHSLHGYFVGPGRPDRPTVYLVDRIRDGRSFVSRSVKAVQDGKTLFIMQASFHVRGDQGPKHSDVMRTVPDPETITVDVEKLSAVHQAMREEWKDWDIRIVPQDEYKHNPYTPTQQVVWFRTKNTLPDDETFHICTLAYMSDMTLLGSALVPHRDEGEIQEASLDHAMWFLRPFRADEWLMYDQISPSAHAGRALTHGRIFNQQGDLVAVVTQEGLTRYINREDYPTVPITLLEDSEDEPAVKRGDSK